MKKFIAALLALTMLLPLTALADAWTDPAEETIVAVGEMTFPMPAEWTMKEAAEEEGLEEGMTGIYFFDGVDEESSETVIAMMVMDLGEDMEAYASLLFEMLMSGFIDPETTEVLGEAETLEVDGAPAMRCTIEEDGVAGEIVMIIKGSACYCFMAGAENAEVAEGFLPYFDTMVERAAFDAEALAPAA